MTVGFPASHVPAPARLRGRPTCGNSKKEAQESISRLTPRNETPTRNTSHVGHNQQEASQQNMPERLRCAVIGTGAFGLDHLNSLLHCPRAAAGAVAAKKPAPLKEAAHRIKKSPAHAE